MQIQTRPLFENAPIRPLLPEGEGTIYSGSLGFPKSARLRKSAEFKAVFDARRSAADKLLIVLVRENALAFSRLGLSVSRKVGNAVVRNRWKRLIREAFRKNRAGFPLNIDMVVIPQKGAAPPSAQELEASLVRLVNRATKKLRNA